MPAATAAAAPPREPPGVRSVSQGLRAGPKRRGSVTGRIPNSGMFVLPTITKPASRSRRTTRRRGPGRSRRRCPSPSCTACPATAAVSLIAIGTPANGRGSSPADRVGGLERALGVDVNERIEAGLERLDSLERRRRPARRELTCPVRTSAASSPAGLKRSSAPWGREPTVRSARGRTAAVKGASRVRANRRVGRFNPTWGQDLRRLAGADGNGALLRGRSSCAIGAQCDSGDRASGCGRAPPSAFTAVFTPMGMIGCGWRGAGSRPC